MQTFIGYAALVGFAVAMFVLVRRARRRDQSYGLRLALDMAGLDSCTLSGHPRRWDVVFAYCTEPVAAERAAQVLDAQDDVQRAEVIGEQRRTVMVTLT